MKPIEINRNEQLYGPSQKVFEILQNFNHEHVYKYGEGYSHSILRDRLAKEFNLPEDQIIIGYGAEDIIRTIFHGLQKDERVLISNQSYTYYRKYLDNQGTAADFYNLEAKDISFEFDTVNILEKYNQGKPKVVIITSPNNPTGNVITPGDLEKVLEVVDKTTLVVLDEAYWGFDKDYDQSAFLALLNKYHNLLMLRSFSKLYGLAGLRIGFGLCGKDVLGIIRWQHQYLGFSRILEEVAIAALDSKEYYSGISKKIIDDREWLIVAVNKIEDIKAYGSKANFVLISFDEKYQSSLVQAFSEQKELIAKIINKCQMRVTIGLTEQVRVFVEVLKKTLS